MIYQPIDDYESEKPFVRATYTTALEYPAVELDAEAVQRVLGIMAAYARRRDDFQMTHWFLTRPYKRKFPEYKVDPPIDWDALRMFRGYSAKLIDDEEARRRLLFFGVGY